MNVIIAAVGGQGALFAARVLGRLAMDSGLEVKASEVHGMSQRGGMRRNACSLRGGHRLPDR